MATGVTPSISLCKVSLIYLPFSCRLGGHKISPREKKRVKKGCEKKKSPGGFELLTKERCDVTRTLPCRLWRLGKRANPT